MALKLGLVMGIGTNTHTGDMDCVKEAENLGFDSIWTSEAWGSDAVTPAAWILAQTSNIKVGTGIIQIAGTDTVQYCHDRHDFECLIWGTFYFRARAFRPAGSGRLVWRSLRSPYYAFAGIC